MLSRFTLTLVAIVAFAVVSFTLLAEATEDIECPVIADTVLCGHSSENNLNCGGRDRLRVKGYQGIYVAKFDMSPVQGLIIEGATFSAYCRALNADSTTTHAISTIAHDWIEGTGDYDESTDSATYLWPGAALGATWGADNNEGSDRYGPIDARDVINGFGGSIVNSNGEMTFAPETRSEIELDAELVQGLVDGTQYGIVLWRDSTDMNLDLASREWQGGAEGPRLIVHTGGPAAVNPGDKMASTWGALKSVR
jgi:hypothetical protein